MNAAMAAALLIIPNTVNAAPPDGVYSGTVAVTNGYGPFFCDFSFQLMGSGTIVDNVALAPGNPLCAMAVFDNQPYGAAFSGSGSGIYAIAGIQVTFLTLPPCSGIILGTWSGSTIDINATIGSCTMVGTIS